MSTNQIVILVCGAVAAFVTDLSAFYRHKEAHPDATFDWLLSLKRIVIGIVTGSLGAGAASILPESA